ncbi:MAG: hypothetical protein LBL74_07845 [Bacteroidales bacterium]|jgi:uncharacterized protein YycO|nr:hypothetical protein [Bacteroidales bacterium]
MKYWVVCLFAAAFLLSCKDKEMHYRQGDLLFQANEPSDFSNAVKGAGKAYEDYTFSHVGIVDISNGDTNVIEAVPEEGVRIVPLKQFLAQSKKDDNGKPIIFTGRLISKYSNAVSPALNRARALVGKAYDSVFLPDNDAYYCSELVEHCFIDDKGRHIFATSPMSFKDSRTNEFFPAWVEFFSRINMPIPEGVAGTNPNDMANSNAITIIR